MINHLVILKSKFLVAIIFSLFVLKMNGQVANYSFSQSTATYAALSTSTPLFTTTWDDNVSVNVAIGFDFVFSGKIYNTTRISSNGFITFGSNAPDANNYTPISYDPGFFGSANYEGAVSAFGRDLINNSSSIVYGIEGVSPNRVFVVQWNNARRWSGGAVLGDVLNFQIRLYETNNVVQVRYGTNTITNTSLLTAQVGLRGASNADFNNRASATNWSVTTAGTANGNTVSSRDNIVPAPGLTFTWIPPACSLLTLPYLENFDTVLTRPNLTSCWRVLDANSDGSTWKTGNGFPNSTPNSLFYEYNSSNVANDWAFSPGFNMVSGEEYEVVFSSRVRNATYPENLRVAYGNARTATGMSNTIATLAGITNTTYSENRYTITPSVSGAYYLGFQAYSNANQWELHVDDIKIIPKIKVTPSAAAICKGSSVSLTATSSGSYTYSWSPSTGLSATTGTTVIATPLSTTTYTVTGTNGAFTTTKQVTVTVNSVPNNITITPTISPVGASGCEIDYVRLQVTGTPNAIAFEEKLNPLLHSWTKLGPATAGVYQGVDIAGSATSNAGGVAPEWNFFMQIIQIVLLIGICIQMMGMLTTIFPFP